MRIYRRPVFNSKERQPTVVFFTSSMAKYLQAKMLFDRVGLQLSPRRSAEDAYSENYSGTKEDLLRQAIAEIHRRGSATGSFLFVEDTSIRIDALSPDDETDFPGLDAKEWFARTAFDDLNHQLGPASRRATVKSCVAMAMPGLTRPLYFYGETSGSIVKSPTRFEPHPFYPWLSPENFSAWLVPDESDSTLSEMSFELSLNFDFRAQALMAMIDRLEELTIAMNATPPMYFRPHAAPTPSAQPPLFRITQKPIILVVGPTCSGKTTLGAYVQQILNWQCIDASSVVRTMREQRDRANVDIADFADEILKAEGPDVVAREIATRFKDSDQLDGLVVTGFRTIEELEFFRDEFENNIRVISVEASERVRYERYLLRNTRAKLNSLTEFRDYDQRQHRLGLLRIAPELADVRILNRFSLDVYYKQVANVLGEDDHDVPPGITRVASRLDPERSQLYRCLRILRGAGRPLTTQEIERQFGSDDSVRYNNANKMLKRYPELASRHEGPGANVKYQITSSGLAFLGAIDRSRREPG